MGKEQATARERSAEKNGLTPAEEFQRLYEEAESRTAAAMEALVQRDSFGELLARVTENVMALTRMGFDAMDIVVRNLRIAGRADIAKLGRQIARTEDKLELVLQEVERLQAELDDRGRPRRSGSPGSRSSGSRSSAAGASRRGRSSSP